MTWLLVVRFPGERVWEIMSEHSSLDAARIAEDELEAGGITPGTQIDIWRKNDNN